MRRRGLIVVGVVILLAAYPTSWLVVTHSDAYATAVDFVKTNPRVREGLGAVRDVSVAPFGYSIRFSGAHGTAHFDLTVSGETASATVYVELEKKGIWAVPLARLVERGKAAIQLQ